MKRDSRTGPQTGTSGMTLVLSRYWASLLRIGSTLPKDGLVKQDVLIARGVAPVALATGHGRRAHTLN